MSLDNNFNVSSKTNDYEEYADKILNSIKFYTFSKNNKKLQALKYYLIAKYNYEQIKLNNDRFTDSYSYVNHKLIQIIKKIIGFEKLLPIQKELLNLDDINYYDYTIMHLYSQLVNLILEINDVEEIVDCYDKIINIYIKESTTIKINFTFTSDQIINFLNRLMIHNHFCYSLHYSLQIINFVSSLVGSFNMISQLNIIIASSYLNLGDYEASGNVLEIEYKRTLSQYDGVLTSQYQILIQMILIFTLYNVNIAKNKLEKYILKKSKIKISLQKFITLFEHCNFSLAKDCLRNEFEYMTHKNKHDIIEAIDRQYASYMISSFRKINTTKNNPPSYEDSQNEANINSQNEANINL